MGATHGSFEIHPLGQVAAGTHADNLRHAYLRAHFMNALLCDPRIIRLFDAWGRETGLYAAADAVARAGRVSHAAKVVEALDSNQVEDGSVAVPALEAGASLAERFYLMLQPGQRPPLRPRPSAFVRDTLKLRWSWLAYELVDSFFRRVYARAFGQVLMRSFTVVYQSPPVPPLALEMSFKAKKGESVAAARRRFVTAAADVLRRMEQAERKAVGRRPKKDSHYLQHWAEWFYRVEVKRPADTVSGLVREYWPQYRQTTAHTLPRRPVQIGIANARRLLSQGLYEIRDTPLPRKSTRRKTAR